MNDVLLFAGTTEGRKIAEACKGQNVTLHVSVATEYGETLIETADNIRVLPGRKDAEQISKLITETNAKIVIDATHPYAASITQTLVAVCRERGTEYMRLLRAQELGGTENCIFVDSTEEAVAYLNAMTGNVLLTVGSKELARYTAVTDYKARLFVRILPLPEAVAQAAALGFEGHHLICMQGAFTEELNAAMLRMLNVQYLVTKDTGLEGGFPEKIRAAKDCGVTPVVIRRPLMEEGVSFAACMDMLEKRFGFTVKADKHITILGAGAGSAGSMTLDAEKAVQEAEVIIGAKRLTDSLSRFRKPVENAISPQDIAALILRSPYRNIAVAMSGDTGFYSGTKSLLPLIANMYPTVLPGISSVSYFCSRISTPWDDALLLSVHGRSCNYTAKIRKNPKVFILTGGRFGVAELIASLNENGLGKVLITVGENLSYENETITSGAAEELAGRAFEPLAVVLAENPEAAGAIVTHGLPDHHFVRGDVPMTKQEIRAVTLSKLELRKTSVCWDVGAGTGSVSLEMAQCCEDGEVFAVEQREAGCELIEENKRRLGVTNLTVIRGTAPDILRQLPAPTHVFIGGSGGNMTAIMKLVLEQNPEARIVLNTVTVETFAEAIAALRTLPVREQDIVQISAARSRKLEDYHLMTAMNPVFIISCTGGTDHE